MRPLVLLTCLLAQAALAGVIHGVALEHATGLPLARARVRLDALSGGRLVQAAATLTNRSGQFVFSSLAAGYYLLK